MADTSYHEPFQELSPEVRDMHRALATLIEELEAVDWYAQRIDATGDDALSAVLAHNRDEEKEHACMTLEWIRRRDPHFDGYLRRYLFTSGSIAELEREETPGPEARGATSPSLPTLGVGSLRDETAEETAS